MPNKQFHTNSVNHLQTVLIKDSH